MNAAGTRNPPPPPILPAIVYDELRSYLRESGSTLSASEALIKAVQYWIAKGRADAIPARGYQWKQLFLPEGTRLRMRFNERWYTATIVGDHKQWANAAILRAQLMKQSVKVPPTAAEAMTIAAKAMSDALSTALTLVAHANDQAQNTLERRLPKYRRAWDQLEDVE